MQLVGKEILRTLIAVWVGFERRRTSFWGCKNSRSLVGSLNVVKHKKIKREGNRGNEDNPINVLLLLLIPLAMSMLFTVSVQHAEEDRVSKRGGGEREENSICSDKLESFLRNKFYVEICM